MRRKRKYLCSRCKRRSRNARQRMCKECRTKWTNEKKDVKTFQRVVRRIERHHESRYRLTVIQVGSAQYHPGPTVQEVIQQIYSHKPTIRSLAKIAW